MCRWHTNKAPTGAAAETRGPPRVFGFFLRVEKETAPPRAVAAMKKPDVMKASAQLKKLGKKIRRGKAASCAAAFPPLAPATFFRFCHPLAGEEKAG